MRSGEMTLREYALETLGRYWPEGRDAVGSLPVPNIGMEIGDDPIPPAMTLVRLPQWAQDICVEGGLLVPSFLVADGENESWKRTDWIGASAWYLCGWAERAFERLNGPIHSYSFRLANWDKRLWEKAWVNRIALFLRRWAAQYHDRDENRLCGPLPQVSIQVTHDVDAIRKTTAIRIKQGAFHLFNAGRSFTRGHWKTTRQKVAQALRFITGRADYWCFDQICDLETRYGVRSQFNFYAGKRIAQRGWSRHLFDPSYDVSSPPLALQIRSLEKNGWRVGLHQSFNAWDSVDSMKAEKKALEDSLGNTVTSCRQHWLRFSWDRTWKAQQKAGLTLDTTLGFNDRPGFRVGAALEFHPWDPETRAPHLLRAVPMVFMDSHFYDYQELTPQERQRQMVSWLDEIKAVRGTATVNWHQRVMSRDYGWGPGFESLLQLLRDR